MTDAAARTVHTAYTTPMSHTSHTALAALAEQVRDAHASRTPLRIRGGGSWMQARWPAHGELLDVSAHRGVVEYIPGDLTITARAGTTLAELQALTAREGQRIALDPVAHPDSTIGAVVATASDGPLSTGYGRVRDQLLGVEFITGNGDVCRAGGRVVKNVAGFDVVRLHTGAWGTLGVITEVSLRVRAAPQLEETWCVVPHLVDSEGITAGWQPAIDALRAVPSVLAAELLNISAARAVRLPPQACMLVRLGGNAAQCAAQRDALRHLGTTTPVDPAVWQELAAPPPSDTLLVQLSGAPTSLATHLDHLQRALHARDVRVARITATPARGILRVAVPRLSNAAPVAHGATHDHTAIPVLLGALQTPDMHASWWQLPEDWWAHVLSPVVDTLSQRLRAALDPRHILNRGLLGEVTP